MAHRNLPRPSTSAAHVVLTGNRATGPLHLGHYAGSLRNHAALQTTHAQGLLFAVSQALTDNAANPGRVRRDALEVALHYSAIPALADLGADPGRGCGRARLFRL